MSQLTVLIADDDEVFQRIIGGHCKRMGLTVQTVTTALHALAVAHRYPPDLLLVDVNMPQGNGLAVCEMLRCDDRFKETPFIVVTSNSDDKTRNRCEDLNASYVLKSPFVWNQIKPLICEAFRIDMPDENDPENAEEAEDIETPLYTDDGPLNP